MRVPSNKLEVLGVFSLQFVAYINEYALYTSAGVVVAQLNL